MVPVAEVMEGWEGGNTIPVVNLDRQRWMARNKRNYLGLNPLAEAAAVGQVKEVARGGAAREARGACGCARLVNPFDYS